jgi:hypothetical protein
MKKTKVGIIASGVVLLSIIASPSASPKNTNTANQPTSNKSLTKAVIPNHLATCDGIKVTSQCLLDNIKYSAYVFHPAVAEKSHAEQVTTYEKKATGYCTLCNDGTYSPSCATGRGACSHHGGVAEWNSPRYSDVPVYTTKTIIDTPAKDAFYEKIPQK